MKKEKEKGLKMDTQVKNNIWSRLTAESSPDVQQCLIELREAEAATREAMRNMYKMLADLGYPVPEV